MRDDGGLGVHLVGDRVMINGRTVSVSKLLGEGGFSYVYLVKDQTEGTSLQSSSQSDGTSSGNKPAAPLEPLMVLKVTSIHSRHQREVAEKEAKLLSRLSHPSIVKMYDASYRTVLSAPSGKLVNSVLGKENIGSEGSRKERPQHFILMEYCEGGHALDVCTHLKSQGKRFDISSLIIAFGQICNAVSYLHAQRPPIVHRDLKPVNFLVKNGAYKLCDFGSAAFGHIDLKTTSQRAEAQEVIEKTTTQMFRAPEMVDLFMTKKLTQSTDVWALGCCLYSLAFLQNCFEENSNLAILSRKYKIPEDNPYGEALLELIDRMLTVDAKARADMTEVILCLSAIYSNRPLPPRKKAPKSPKKVESEGEPSGENDKRERVGSYRTDGQGIRTAKAVEPKKPAEAKKLNPNSAAARRRRQASQTSEISPRDSQTSKRLPSLASSGTTSPDFENSFPSEVFGKKSASFEDDLAFSTTENPFASAKGDEEKKGDSTDDGFALDKTGRDGSDGADKDFGAFERDGFWEVPKSNSRGADSEEQEVTLGMEHLLRDRYSPRHTVPGENAIEGSKKGTNAQFQEERPKKKPSLRSLGLFR